MSLALFVCWGRDGITLGGTEEGERRTERGEMKTEHRRKEREQKAAEEEIKDKRERKAQSGCRLVLGRQKNAT